MSRMGGDRPATQRRRYRQEAEARSGGRDVESPWDSLEGGILLGAKDWVDEMRRVVKGDAKEQGGLRRLQPRPEWEQVVEAVEAVKGERWESFRDRIGDWGRDMVLLLGRREGALKLGELGELCGGLDYRSVGGAIKKAMVRLGKDQVFQNAHESARKQLTQVKQ